MRRNLIAAVDLGSYKFSASLGVEDKGELDILDSISEKSSGVKKGKIIDVDKCAEALQILINKLSLRSNEMIKDIYIGISSNGMRISEKSASVNLKEGIVKASDIHRAMERCKRNVEIAEDEDIIDLDINFYKLDNKVLKNEVIGWKGSTLEINFTAVILKKEEIQRIIDVCKASNLNLRGIKSNIMVGKKIFLNNRATLGTKALIDIGATTSDIAIFKDGVLKNISFLPLGGENITKDIEICAKVNHHEAESLKKMYSDKYETFLKEGTMEYLEEGPCKIDKELFYQIINARIEEIIKYVKNQLKNTSYFDGICSIIIYGEGITCYENIFNLIKNEFNAHINIITGEILGLKSIENINSLAIVKDVYDRLKLESNDLNGTKEKPELEVKEDDRKEIEDQGREQMGFIKKIKSFFQDIF